MKTDDAAISSAHKLISLMLLLLYLGNWRSGKYLHLP